VRAVMIDLDGTLLDTVGDLAVAADAMRAELGMPPLPAGAVRDYVGKGIPVLVRRALTGRMDGEPQADLFERALAIFNRCYEAVNGRSATVYPGVREGLDAFRAMGLALACVTNKSERFTAPLLAATGLAGYFRIVVAGDTLARRKPDPLPLTHACGELGIAPGEMLMIGDSANDAIAARAAGCPVFCVPYGYNEGVDVRALDVDAIVATLFEASKLITRS
jgi:phosphoglycolate phosphatase